MADDYDGYSDASLDASPQGDTRMVANQPHDEEVNLSDGDESSPEPSPFQGGMHDGPQMAGTMPRGGTMPGDEYGSDDDGLSPNPSNKSDSDADSGSAKSDAEPPMPSYGTKMAGMEQRPTGGGGGDEGDEDGKSVEGSGDITVGGYNPADFEHLQVSDEIRELFQYIGRYKPQSHQLDSKLKPFIPDYIPAVGDIDEFIKVGRPDGKPEELGLNVLDEPSGKQSDPTVLNLQLRQVTKKANLKPVEVTAIESADKSGQTRKIEDWVKNIKELHKNKPRPQVSYSKNMPDIETLMQEWPAELEDTLKHLQLPDENVDLNLHDYVKVMCNILDIPVYQNHVESLHVLLTLFQEFKNNPFLQGGGGGAPVGMAGMGSSGSHVMMMDG